MVMMMRMMMMMVMMIVTTMMMMMMMMMTPLKGKRWITDFFGYAFSGHGVPALHGRDPP
jgi:hypothetical protein